MSARSFGLLEKPTYYLFTPSSDGLSVQEFHSLDEIASEYTDTIHGLPAPRADFGDPMEWDENECVILKAVLIQPKPKKIALTFEDE